MPRSLDQPPGRAGHTLGSLGGGHGCPRAKAISQPDQSSQRVPDDFAKTNKIHNRRLVKGEGTSAAEQLPKPCLSRRPMASRNVSEQHVGTANATGCHRTTDTKHAHTDQPPSNTTTSYTTDQLPTDQLPRVWILNDDVDTRRHTVEQLLPERTNIRLIHTYGITTQLRMA